MSGPLPTPARSLVRRASVDDHLLVAALYRSLAADLWGGVPDDLDARVRALFADAAALVVIAVDVGDGVDTPLGFALVHDLVALSGRRQFYLDDLFVVPSARRRGVASQLFAAIDALAEERGAAVAFAHVVAGNVDLRRVLARAGYGEPPYLVFEKRFATTTRTVHALADVVLAGLVVDDGGVALAPAVVDDVRAALANCASRVADGDRELVRAVASLVELSGFLRGRGAERAADTVLALCRVHSDDVAAVAADTMVSPTERAARFAAFQSGKRGPR